MRISRARTIAASASIVLLAAVSSLAAETPAGTAAVLRVGVDPNLPPMIFKEGKNIAGVEADLAQALGRDLGRPLKFVEVPWAELVDALNDNKIDIIMSAMSVTRARQFRVAFADPYLRIGQMALVRADEKFRYGGLGAGFANQTIGVKKATTGDLLVQQEFPRAKRKYYDSGEEGAKALVRKKIDLFICDSPIIWYLAGTYEAQGLVAAPMVLSDETLAWAVRRSDTALLDSANTFLKKAATSGELSKILRRWIPKFQ